MVITIDGPVASGKSTAARLLAERIGFYHFSSGLLFRALAYLLTKYAGYTEKKLHTLVLSDIAYYLDPQRFTCTFDAKRRLHILFEGKDITPFLKQKELDQAASIIGINPDVRQAMLSLQRIIAQSYNLVVDGRDSGSVVFPDAVIKFFLTASVEVRALRWQQAQKKRGADLSLQETIKQIKVRDERDKSRKVAPLIIPENAIIIDNSGYSIQETVDVLESYVQSIHR